MSFSTVFRFSAAARLSSVQLPCSQKLPASQVLAAPLTSSSSLCHPPAHTPAWRLTINTAGWVVQSCQITTRRVPLCNYASLLPGPSISILAWKWRFESGRAQISPSSTPQPTTASISTASFALGAVRRDRFLGSTRPLGASTHCLGPSVRTEVAPNPVFGMPAANHTSSFIPTKPSTASTVHPSRCFPLPSLTFLQKNKKN